MKARKGQPVVVHRRSSYTTVNPPARLERDSYGLQQVHKTDRSGAITHVCDWGDAYRRPATGADVHHDHEIVNLFLLPPESYTAVGAYADAVVAGRRRWTDAYMAWAGESRHTRGSAPEREESAPMSWPTREACQTAIRAMADPLDVTD